MAQITFHINHPKVSNPVIRFLAHFFSVLFHPLCMASYVIAFLIFVHPFAFSGMDLIIKRQRFIPVFFSPFFFPLFSIFIARRLGLIRSLYLHTTRDRIIPYVMVMVFYFWAWFVFKNLDNASVATHFLLGAFLAICAAWMCNIYYKIYMHAVGLGGLFIFFLLFSFNDPYGSGLYLSLATLITGLVCTSRFIISDHSAFDIYTGLAAGAVMQWIAWQF